jgi:hypothetical protein
MNLDAFPASFIEKNFPRPSVSSLNDRPIPHAASDAAPEAGSHGQALPEEVVFQFSFTIKQTARGLSVVSCGTADPSTGAPGHRNLHNFRTDLCMAHVLSTS